MNPKGLECVALWLNPRPFDEPLIFNRKQTNSVKMWATNKQALKVSYLHKCAMKTNAKNLKNLSLKKEYFIHPNNVNRAKT